MKTRINMCLTSRNLFRQLPQNIQPEMVESMAKHEVTPAQLFVLASLKKHGSRKVSEIAERMEVKPSAVTLMADRLEQKGLIVRKHNQQDRRVIDISLTKKAKQNSKMLWKDGKRYWRETYPF